MRLTRSAIATVLALGLVPVISATALAQGTDLKAPAAVLGWVVDETHYADGTSGEVGDMYVREGVAYTYRLEASDPRLDGDAIWTGTGHRFPTDPIFEVQSATWKISNDDGAWSGTSTAIVGTGLGDADTVVLTGEGAYEGLSAYLIMDWSRGGANFRGAIFPGGMPPLP